ncbi:hypothetical protein BU17DRAFT_55443 [Hysterangium stoloniferum]|nr:hypothetical protein BU17DRAFT_55443 [Hysterangium stoloniferum]
MSVQVDTRRPQRQDTFDLRGDIHTDEGSQRGHVDVIAHTSDEEHSLLEDASSDEDNGEYMDDDDGSSSLSIPNESIDFDLVYSLHNFAATVEGQASVVKGDSLFLMDDSNSYWWLVRVLTTQEVGYIPAENIETPFERLARLNKHRNVDLASATHEEMHENIQLSRDRLRGVNSINDNTGSPTIAPGNRKSVIFDTASQVFNYPPAVWGEEDMDGDEDWDEDEMAYEDEYDGDPEEAINQVDGMEPDDGISWDDTAVEEERARAATLQTGLSPTTASAPANIATNGEFELTPIVISGQQKGLATNLRQQTSRERLQANERNQSPPSPSSPATGSPASASSTARMFVDPAIAGETKKISVTPSIAREAARQSLITQQQQEESAKRAREEAEAMEESTRKRNKVKDVQPVSSNMINRVVSIESAKSVSSGGGKLRKERGQSLTAVGVSSQDDDGVRKDKKKNGVFGGLFGRKKDKRDKSGEGIEGIRNSEDSAHSVSGSDPSSPRKSNSTDPRRVNAGSTPTPGQAPSSSAPAGISQHSLRMQQIDQQQQLLYQQYLKSSPASAPEGPSYGLQSASSIMPSPNGTGNTNLSTAGFRTQGGRPGSLILSPTNNGDGQGVPELSVIRIFAGPNLHTEATFKTVLLNTSTTSGDLIRQAMQRFRLAAGEDAADYYLEIKQVEGHSAVLLPHERPLGVFETLVEAAQLEVPKVKRSSVGSISSVSSNLSMHPAIKKLSMNDFTDDSAVKFYLNRRSSRGGEANAEEESILRLSVSEYDDLTPTSPNNPLLTLTTANGTNVTPERFSSPSARFALQVYILPEDLPDGMIFDPHTEAIVPKISLRDRSMSNAAASSGVSQSQRRKVLQFPKNTTVAEVIELALERFGIAEGVVDGGDEIEDKLAKRMSLARVRYGLAVQIDSQEERQLHPSSKILDAFQRPPVFRSVDRRSGEKRRSVDSAMLLASADDIKPDDPVFILRRAVGLRNTGKSKMAAPLDEIALQYRHQRESLSDAGGSVDENKPPMSRQELIAAQRLASREKQRAILSAQTNSERGMDVLLPGNAMLRSSLHETGDRMRYSYVQDGETYDISDIIEEEQRGARAGSRQDWLEGVVARGHEGLGENLDRVLSRIKGSKQPSGKSSGLSSETITVHSQRASDLSSYSAVDPEDMTTPVESVAVPTSSSRGETPHDARTASRAASATPTKERSGSKNDSLRDKQPSNSSLRSEDSSNEVTTPSTPATTATNPHNHNARAHPRPLVVRNDFGVADMISIIELNAAASKRVPLTLPPPMDHVDEMLFGTRVNLEDLHPRVREMYGGTLKQLDDMDRVSWCSFFKG